MEFEPMLTPREKSPLPENFPRGGSNAVDSKPKHYQWAIPAPRTHLNWPMIAYNIKMTAQSLTMIKSNPNLHFFSDMAENLIRQPAADGFAKVLQMSSRSSSMFVAVFFSSSGVHCSVLAERMGDTGDLSCGLQLEFSSAGETLSCCEVKTGLVVLGNIFRSSSLLQEESGETSFSDFLIPLAEELFDRAPTEPIWVNIYADEVWLLQSWSTHCNCVSGCLQLVNVWPGCWLRSLIWVLSGLVLLSWASCMKSLVFVKLLRPSPGKSSLLASDKKFAVLLCVRVSSRRFPWCMPSLFWGETDNLSNNESVVGWCPVFMFSVRQSAPSGTAWEEGEKDSKLRLMARRICSSSVRFVKSVQSSEKEGKPVLNKPILLTRRTNAHIIHIRHTYRISSQSSSSHNQPSWTSELPQATSQQNDCTSSRFP